METYRLICHPDTPAVKVRSVDAYVVRNRENYLHFRWRIKGTRALVVPEFVGPGREDGLWQTTCFELFFKALKQNLKIKTFVGTSANAVRIQI